jgi:co-chaperonin GroES (HSP10)
MSEQNVWVKVGKDEEMLASNGFMQVAPVIQEERLANGLYVPRENKNPNVKCLVLSVPSQDELTETEKANLPQVGEYVYADRSFVHKVVDDEDETTVYLLLHSNVAMRRRKRA